MKSSIPESHQDLLLQSIHGVLSTMMPNGQPQMSVVWVDFDGEHILINTTLERQKGRNMQANPRVNVLVIDPKNASRFLEIRGEVVDITENGAIPHADKLTRAYTNNAQQHFYGDIYPEDQKEKETRVIARIFPKKITTDAIFA